VITHPVATGGDNSLRFVGPKDDQIVANALTCGFVETSLGVGIEGELQERVDVAAFDLIALWN
jgi:hypothetical protein